jgi:hypothetical protein
MHRINENAGEEERQAAPPRGDDGVGVRGEGEQRREDLERPRAEQLLAELGEVAEGVQQLDRVVLGRGRRQVGPEDAGWPMHSCGNTAIKG